MTDDETQQRIQQIYEDILSKLKVHAEQNQNVLQGLSALVKLVSILLGKGLLSTNEAASLSAALAPLAAPAGETPKASGPSLRLVPDSPDGSAS